MESNRPKIIDGILILIWCLILLVAPAQASEDEIQTFNFLNANEIAASGTWTSPAIPLTGCKGYFSLEVVATGSGTAKIEYLLSNYDNKDSGTFLTPGTASDIVTAHTVGSDTYSFDPMLAKWMQIKVTETTATDSITLTMKLSVQ